MKKDITTIKKRLLSKEFKPKRFLSNPHLQTILGIANINKHNKTIEKGLKRSFSVYDDIVGGDCYWQINKKDKTTIILIHGIGGSSREPYILRFVKKAFKMGYNVVALNLRSCGGTESISKRLYNAGDSNDILYLIKELTNRDKLKKFFILGISLGGNVCLKLAGELQYNNLKSILGIAAISPLVNLNSAEKNIDDESRNRFYKKHILKSLKNIIIKKHRHFPEYDVTNLKKISSIKEFDKSYHVDIGEFKSVNFYYKNTSAKYYLKNIKLPTLIIHSKDDPIIPVKDIESIRSEKNIILLISKYGGHAGFIGDEQYGDSDKYWAENRILEFFDYLN